MKKKIASLLGAAMLLMALPTLAWAADSPSNQASASNPSTNTSIHVSADIPANTNGALVVDPVEQVAKNYVSTGNDVLVSTYEIHTKGDLKSGDVKNVTVTFNVGSRYAGWTARAYVEHDGGATETHTLVVAADGTVTFTMDRLSFVTIAIEGGQTPAASTANPTDNTTGTGTGNNAGATSGADMSSTSPQTGVDFSGAAAATAMMAVAACGVAVALRKKIAE